MQERRYWKERIRTKRKKKMEKGNAVKEDVVQVIQRSKDRSKKLDCDSMGEEKA